jgi:Pyruvate/2-oxoacid:ferredoxin oxidoreductase gamma subunit
MIEIGIHARGGRGNVAAAELLANPAFRDSKFAQPFPSLGAQRVNMGPVVKKLGYNYLEC